MTRKTSVETDVKNVMTPLVQALIRSGKILYLVLFAIILFLIYQLWTKNEGTSSVEYDTALIQLQIKNVSKLVVTEAHFAEVMTYKNTKKTYIPGLSFDKKALIVINADVTVGFDLSKMEYEINEEEKIIKIRSIPKMEIKIAPDYKYYDVDQSTFNEFSGDDYNKINKTVRENLAKKIEKSSLKSNAKNRLLSELSNIFILSKSLGWKLEYNDKIVNDTKELQSNVKL